MLITSDKDFGELVFQQNLVHTGIVLLRLVGLTAELKAEVVATALREHESELVKAFSVISHNIVRIRGKF